MAEAEAATARASEPLLLRALRRQPVERTPLWFMRQAGRYLDEYRAVREKAGDFMTLCRTPELACEVTLQPVVRFDLDAAILFSDILTVPDAMGLGLSVTEGKGPRFAKPVGTAASIRRLGAPDPESELRYVMDAVRTIRRSLPSDLPLIGFAGAPWTLASYMVEGRGGHDFQRVKALATDQPEAFDQLLGLLIDAVGRYLEAQVRAGVDVLMLFDSWAGALSPPQFLRCSRDPMARIVAHLRRTVPEVPVIAFAKGCGAHLEALAETGADALGVDWTQSLADARRRVGSLVALQGNFDPSQLFASLGAVRSEADRVLADFGRGAGHVFNLGHGILPKTPVASVEAMVEAVRERSPTFHGPH